MLFFSIRIENACILKKKVEHKNFLLMQNFKKCVWNFRDGSFYLENSTRIFFTSPMSENKKWTKEQIIKLIELRNNVEWNDRFNESKGKARQIGMLWNDLSNELGDNFSGLELKNQYNYLLNQFKKHNLIAKRSGEGAINWPFYTALKEHLIKNPTVTPVCLLDDGEVKNSKDTLRDESSCDNTLISESTVVSAAEKPKKIKVNINERIAQSMENKNKILETLLTQNNVSFNTVKDDVQYLKDEISKTNSKIDTLLDAMSKFLNEKNK